MDELVELFYVFFAAFDVLKEAASGVQENACDAPFGVVLFTGR